MAAKLIKVTTGTGRRLAAIRQGLKISRAAMAARLMVTPSSYHRNENGETFPSEKSLKILHDEFGISMEWLIFNHGPMYVKDLDLHARFEIQKEQLKESEGGRQELSRRLEEAEKRLEPLTWLEEAGPEMKDFLDAMSADPQLRFEVLAHFFKHKKE